MSENGTTKLRLAREYRGWPRQYVAEQVGVDLGTIGRWERGESLPHPHYRQKVCDLFGMNAQDLGLLPSSQDEEALRERGSNTNESPPLRKALPRIRFSRRMLLVMSAVTTGIFVTSGLLIAKVLLSPRRVEPIGKPLRDEGSSPVNNVLWSPDQNFLGVATDTNYLAIWSVHELLDPTYHKSFYAPSNFFVNDMSWSHQSSFISAACADYHGHGALRIWSFPRGDKLLDQSFGPLRAVAWSPKDDILAYGGDIGSVQVLDIRTSQQPRLSYYGHGKKPVNSIRWSPDGKFIASADEAGAIYLWNATTGQTVQSYQPHQARVIDLSWSPDGTLLASASEDTTVQIWDPLSARQRYLYKKHTDSVHCVCWSPTDNILVSGGTDRTVRVWQWNGDEGQDLAVLDKHSYIYSACWNPKSLTFAVGCRYEGIELWAIQ